MKLVSSSLELKNFKDRWLQEFRGIDLLQCPSDNGMHIHGGVRGITLYRDPPFQVQLFIADPNIVIPPHIHPDVDTYEIYLRGMRTNISQRTVHEDNLEADEFGLSPLHGRFLFLAHGRLHGAVASSGGGLFLSIQEWLNGVEPTNLGYNWEGERTGGDVV